METKENEAMTKFQAHRFLTVFLIAVCLLWAPVMAAEAPPPCDLHFTILHTNDLHAHDDPYIEHGRSIGGMDRIVHLIHSIKSHNPDDVLTIDAGDIFQGTPYFKFYHGATEVELLNDAGYDIYTIGNHEFDNGPDNLAKQLKAAKFDVVDCNLDASGCPELAAEIKRSVVKTIHGQKVGFIGAILPDLKSITLLSGKVNVINAEDDWIAPIREEIARLKEQGVNKIILVTHVGVDLDRKLAALPEVDAIIGGHSHTRLDKPIIIEHPDGSHCIIVQTGCYGKALGKLDLAFSPDGKIDLPNVHYHLINITGRIKADPAISSYLREKAQPFIAQRRSIVGIAEENFNNNFRNTPEDSALGDLVTDALAAGTAGEGATITINNRGGIRTRIDKGPISEEMVNELLPFDDNVMVASVSGQDLLKILENSVGGTAASPIMLGARFLDVHGLKFEWDPLAEQGHRVHNVLAANASGQLKALDPNAQYRLAVNSYTFGGGEGYDFSRAQNVKNTGSQTCVYLRDYLIKQKKVQPKTSQRIVPLHPVPISQFTPEIKKLD
jgi:5'-nucleotidase / UDP-sugar diphosphatase